MRASEHGMEGVVPRERALLQEKTKEEAETPERSNKSGHHSGLQIEKRQRMGRDGDREER